MIDLVWMTFRFNLIDILKFTKFLAFYTKNLPNITG